MLKNTRPNSLLKLFCYRGLQALVVALVVGILSFAMLQALPGDIAYRIAAGRYGYDMMDAAAAAAVRLELGLDEHWTIQLFSWLGSILQFDLGRSLVYGKPVIDEISLQLGYTLLLAASSLLVSLLISLPLGIIAGINPGGLVDRLSLAFSVFLRAIPAFALGLVLVLIFAVHLKLLPVAGFRGFEHLILPSLTLGLGLASVSNRIVKDSVQQAMASDWRLFARTKGLSRKMTLLLHALRNAALPIVAYVGVQLAFIIEGVVIVETIFAWPGIGHALVHAIFNRDIAMLQGTALCLGLLYVLLNLVIDILCRAIDPRLGSKGTQAL